MAVIKLILLLATIASPTIASNKIACNYETKSHLREGRGKFDVQNVEPALQYCTHLIYGYAAINDNSLKLVPINEQFDIIKNNYRKITELKQKYPKIKILLSVGGNDDISGDGSEKNLKYREVLESSTKRLAFINSAYTLIKAYNFDGIDLAWEFPETKPKKIKTGLGAIWSSIKKSVAGESVIDDKAAEHREQFTSFVRELKTAFKDDNYLVSLTVLPNVNSTVYYDPKNLSPYLDLINLHAFDFYTPERNSKLADYPAPLYELIDRRPDENVDAQVKYWLSNGAPNDKILLGLPTYGRTWRIEADTKVEELPLSGLEGPGEPGPLTKEAGLLSYPEICEKVKSRPSVRGADLNNLYKSVPDSTKRRGVYAYRLPDDNNKGIWIGYEDPESAANKAAYAKAKGLGGIAIDDITLDDFRGSCSDSPYPILRAVKSRL